MKEFFFQKLRSTMKNRDTKKTTMTRVSEKNLMAYYPLKTKNIYIYMYNNNNHTYNNAV